MLQATLPHTAGDSQRQVLDYSDWLAESETLTGVSTQVSGLSATMTVTSQLLATDGRKLQVIVSGGVAGETDTVTVTVTTSLGQTKNDTIAFNVVAA